MSDLSIESQSEQVKQAEIAAQETVETSDPREPVPIEGTDEIPADTAFRDLKSLQNEYPELYDSIIMGIANNIINDMKRSQERFKEIMREAKRQ